MVLTNLFVYGLLRKGESLHYLIEPYLLNTKENVTFNNLGMYIGKYVGYPYVVWQTGSFVIGDIVTLNTEVIDTLDKIELSEGYKRSCVNWLFVYLYDKSVAGCRYIENGDWKLINEK